MKEGNSKEIGEKQDKMVSIQYISYYHNSLMEREIQLSNYGAGMNSYLKSNLNRGLRIFQGLLERGKLGLS